MVIVKASARMLAVRGAVVLLSVLNTILTARLLMPEGRGGYALITAALSIFNLSVGPIGSGVALSVAHEEESVKRRTITTALGISIALGILPLLGLTIWHPHGTIWLPVLVASAAMPFYLFAGSVHYTCLGSGRLGWISTFQLLQAVAILLFGLVFMGFLHYGLTGAMLAWSLSSILVFLASIAALKEMAWGLRLSDLTPSVARRLVRFGVGAALPGAATVFGSRALLFFIQIRMGIKSVGIYSVALATAEPLATLSTGLSFAAYPSLIRTESRAITLRRFVQLGLATLIALAALIEIASGRLLVTIFGPAYTGALVPLPFLLLAYAINGIREIVMFYYMHETRRLQVPIRASAASLLTTLVLAWPLIVWFGLTGAAISGLAGVLVGIAGMLLPLRSFGLPLRSLLLPNRDDIGSIAHAVAHLSVKRGSRTKRPGSSADI